MTSQLLPLVVFDMDGTLLDTRLDIARAANNARFELGLPSLSIEEVVRAVGDGVNLFVSRVTFPEDHARFSEARKVFLRHYGLNVTGDTKPYEGIQTVLQYLKVRGFPMAVVSNKPERLVDELIRHFHWEDYFSSWLGGDSAAKPKPAADPLLMAIEKAGLSKTHPVLMIGDGVQDVLAAKSLGCKVYWCAWGFNETQPEGYDSERVDEPESLIPLFNAYLQ